MIHSLVKKIIPKYMEKRFCGVAVMESPKQLLNFLCYVPNSRRYNIFVRCSNSDKTAAQMLSLAESRGLKAKYFFFGQRGSISYFASLFGLLLAVLQGRLLFGQSDLAMGDARSIVFALVKPWFWKKVSLVDDGMYLYAYIKHARQMSGVTIYTNLPIAQSSKYEVVQLKCNKKSIAKESSSVAFIGSKVVDAGIISLESFELSMRHIFSYYHEKGFSRISYVAHRSETQVVLSSVARLGFVLIELDSTIEEHFSVVEQLPEVIASFYSTALYNLSCEYDGNFHSFRLKDQDLLWNNLSIQQVYELFDSSENIKVIALP